MDRIGRLNGTVQDNTTKLRNLTEEYGDYKSQVDDKHNELDSFRQMNS